jgi:hypothetical protein
VKCSPWITIFGRQFDNLQRTFSVESWRQNQTERKEREGGGGRGGGGGGGNGLMDVNF